jgi:hypothetical protein
VTLSKVAEACSILKVTGCLVVNEWCCELQSQVVHHLSNVARSAQSRSGGGHHKASFVICCREQIADDPEGICKTIDDCFVTAIRLLESPSQTSNSSVTTASPVLRVQMNCLFRKMRLNMLTSKVLFEIRGTVRERFAGLLARIR